MLQMEPLAIGDRALIHLYQWRRGQGGPELSDTLTQEGISVALDVNRAHITRIIRPLVKEGLVDTKKERVTGKERKLTCYVLTSAGLGRAREILERMGDEPIDLVEGRTRTRTNVRTLLQERNHLGELTIADAAGGELHVRGEASRLVVSNATLQVGDFYGRETELDRAADFFGGDATVLAVYANHGYGSSAFLRKACLELTEWPMFWHDLRSAGGAEELQSALAGFWANLGGDPDNTGESEACVLCFDNYKDVKEDMVDLLISLVAKCRKGKAKLAVSLPDDTPAYNRFYQRADVKEGVVQEIHLGRFDEETARKFIGEDLDPEAFQMIYMLTRGQPLALAMVRSADEDGLRRLRPNEEVRFLMYLRTRRRAEEPERG
jgi:DNA-binding PadR family transcriptional regulator